MSGHLGRGFRGAGAFAPVGGYRLLPARFSPLDGSRYVLSNLAGEYRVLRRESLEDLVMHRLGAASPLYDDLKAGHFLADSDSGVHRELVAAQCRTRKSRIPDMTALHLFVVTLRCDAACQYCQVSRASGDASAFDMSRETADLAIGLMFQSPSPSLTVEIQGGEPLLNFPLVRHIVETVARRSDGRAVRFVICSNLAHLTDEVLDFASAHAIYFSTSLDGPPEVHDRNRPRPGQDGHARAADGIARVRARLGPAAVSALMTTSAWSLEHAEAIVDEYARFGFEEIFLRPVRPYGHAARSAGLLGYAPDRYVEFYKRGLSRILALNRRGVRMREFYSALLLRSLLTPFPNTYVDLQSPAGIGLATVAYNYDGGVYASDEGRMLAEMGDKSFRLGTVRDPYGRLFVGSGLLGLLHRTILEGVPGCGECAFLPFCGSDPVYHHRTQGDGIGHKPTSGFCRRQQGILRHLIALLEDDPDAAAILRGWAR